MSTRRRPSLRAVVTTVATLGVLLVLIGVSAILLDRQRENLTEHLDDSLAAEAERLASIVGLDGPISSGDDRIVVVVDGSGTPVIADINGQPFDPSEVVAAVEPDDDGAITVRGERWRVVSYRYPSGLGVVYVGGEFEDIEEAMSALRDSLEWIVPLATVVLGLLIWIVVGRTLRPVERIRAEVAAIGPADLDRRVEVPASGDEISRLADTMNAMLDRLQASAKRQERFVADASHELRTPLTRMRAELEADEAAPAGADVAATRRSQLDEIDGLQRLIEDLLLVAQGEHEPFHQRRLLDLDDIVLDEIRRERGHRPTVTIDAHDVSAAQIAGNADHLRRVVRNLLDNACRHARSTVTVQLSERDGMAKLAVGDDGPGIPPDLGDRVFERFSRVDESRSGASGGTGLGLAIVRDIVQRHGGHIEVGTSSRGGAQFVALFPAAPAARPAGRSVNAE